MLRITLGLLILASTHFVAPSYATSSMDTKIERLFARDWEWRLREFPEMATGIGDHRYDDRLSEISMDATERRRAYRQHLDKTLRQFDPRRLSLDNRLSLAVFRWQLDEELAYDNFYRTQGITEEWNAINHFGGVHIGFSSTVAMTRFESETDYRNYIARLDALAQRLDAAVKQVRHGAARGWLLPKAAVERVPGQIERILGKNTESSAWYAPLRKLPASLSPALADDLRTMGRRVLEQRTLPALRRYRDFVQQEYLPIARTSVGTFDLPNGQAYYRLAVRGMTSLDSDPEAIHHIGLSEVARIRERMTDIARKQGFLGTLEEYITMLRARPDQYYETPDALLAGYREIGKRVDPEMARVFKALPRAPWGVRPAAPEEQGNADHYLAAAADGSRAGYFVVDNSNPRTRPRFEMTALVLHEAVPGHHLQTALAAELTKLPAFRRHGWFPAYGEGWALYSESLGEELGLYRDDNELFGRLTYEIWRAARLVIDTGIHELGWSRDHAIDYLRTATGGDIESVAAEVDRYIVWPGQALAYKIGEITLRRLRDKATMALGADFDLRAFHQQVLNAGTLPLALLETRVDVWIHEELRRLRSKSLY